jgi:hypothetical protein
MIFLHSHQQGAVSLLALLAVGTAFSTPFVKPTRHSYSVPTNGALYMTSEKSTSITSNDNNVDVVATEESYLFSEWATNNGIVINSKLSPVRDTINMTQEERGKGGVEAKADISALEVLARIPRALIVSTLDAPMRSIEAANKATAINTNSTWATYLTAAALVALHPTDEELPKANTKAKQQWVATWEAGGWGTDRADLGSDDVNFGAKDVIGSLLATGSDNDHNVFAKFRMPCHPTVLRSAVGLGVLTGCTTDEAREALTTRGKTYRSMNDALQELVLAPTPFETRKGSNRERRSWDVADTLSRVLSRATMLQLDDDDTNDNNSTPMSTYAIVPLHERLSHCDSANSKLVALGEEVLLVATRDISAGEAITRDYTAAPRLDHDVSEGPLHLLLQFGLPPSAW